MRIPFIGFGNEDVIYNLNYEPFFLNEIETIIFKYILLFKKNEVEKFIAFFKKCNSSIEEIENNKKLVFNKDVELYLDDKAKDNQFFAHITHDKKISKADLDILDYYLKTFFDAIYDVHISLDKTCPFAISFSFSFYQDKIKEINMKRYKQLSSN